jgi:hypothetical protein
MQLRALALALAFLAAIGATHAGRVAPAAADTPPANAQLFISYVAGSPCDAFLETFDEPGVWFTGEQNGLLAQVTGGEYRLFISGGGSIWMIPAPVCAITGYRATVDARWAGKPGNFIGLLFGLDDVDRSAYLFVVNTDHRVWLLFEVQDGSLNALINATGNDAILPGGAVNRLSAERAGGSILLSINDTLVGELPADQPGNPVTAGVVAATYTDQSTVDARFDNFHYLYLTPTSEK